MTASPPHSAEHPDPQEPRDDPDVERIFGRLCRQIPVAPNETFVARAQRWTKSLAMMAALGPRNPSEWSLAADVVVQYEYVAIGLAAYRSASAASRSRNRVRFHRLIDGKVQALREAMCVYAVERAANSG